MKKIINIAAGCVLLAALTTGCKKDTPITGTDASLANVSFTNVNSSAKTVNFLVNGSLVNIPTVPVVGGTILGTYAGVAPGSNVITVSDVNGPFPIYYSDFQRVMQGGSSYSFFVYDTIVTPTGQLKGLLLNTDRIPDVNSANAKFRFLNFSPKSPLMDVVMVRQISNGATTPALVAKDSVLISTGLGYIGATTPNIASLSAYYSLTANQNANSGAGNLATNYIVKFKPAGVNSVITSSTLTILPGKNYTLMLRGVYPSISLAILTNN